MRVLALGSAYPDTSPGSRFRIEQWMRVMRRRGVDVDYAGFEDEELHRYLYTEGNYLPKAAGVMRGFASRFSLLRHIREYDVVFIYEEAARLGPAIIERLIVRAGVPIVYDFCDPIYLSYKSPKNGYLSYLKFVGKTASICRMASHVLVGNEPLAEYAQKFNANVTIVPITIDTEEYQPHSRSHVQPDDVPVIGWTGSHSTIWHLDSVRPVLRRLAETRRYRLRVIGTDTWSEPGVDATAQPWRAGTEVPDLQTFDIGLMPLPEHPFVRHRTQLKVRQYMGLAIPSIVSPVGVNTELIQDGENGFLASSEDQWLDKMTRLVDDPALRARLGAAGRRTIEERYSAAIWAPRVLDILRKAAQSRNRGAELSAHS